MEVVVIQMPAGIRNLPLAEPCCFFCYKKETEDLSFLDLHLMCGCSPDLHRTCAIVWREQFEKPLCPNCGKEWMEQKSCCEICLWLTSILSCLSLLIILCVIYITKLL